jgi:hypothetical protein
MIIYADFGECENPESCPREVRRELAADEGVESMNVVGIDIEMNEWLIEWIFSLQKEKEESSQRSRGRTVLLNSFLEVKKRFAVVDGDHSKIFDSIAYVIRSTF